MAEIREIKRHLGEIGRRQEATRFYKTLFCGIMDMLKRCLKAGTFEEDEMRNKLLAGILAGAIAMVAFATPAFAAVSAGQKRVTVGADLSAAQKTQVYDYFGITPGDVKELTVTNAEEKQYLKGLVSDEKIGNVALSCISLETLSEGSGLNITTNNINFCTTSMYKNALTTAGITDASVMITAPKQVSGTAALTGIYKAYEDITGKSLNTAAKAAGTEQLVVSGNLTQSIGDENTQKLLTELQGILAQTKNMSDSELRDQILTMAKNLNVTLTDDQVNQLITLCRTLANTDLASVGNTITKMSQTMNGVSGFMGSVQQFFAGVGNWFTNLFGGNKTAASASASK
jgi:uncharacterized protein YpuA (DUF1002 family)